MEFPHNSSFAFDQKEVNRRIHLFELSEEDLKTGELLHKVVIHPHRDRIIDKFYDYLMSNREFRQYFSEKDEMQKLKNTLAGYLDKLGLEFNTAAYFDVRFRIGIAHHRIELPLILYIASFRKLNEIVYEYIPREVKDEIHSRLGVFLLRIINLDASIAIDSYYRLNDTLQSEDIKKLESQNKLLKSKATHDPLTNVYNRTSILNYLKKEIERCSRDKPLSVLIVDIVDLGSINDTFGHFSGDIIVKEVASRISAGAAHTVGRYGGDEFLLILRNTDASKAKNTVETLSMELNAHPVHLGQQSHAVKISYGLLTVKDKQADLSHVLQQSFDNLNANKLGKTQ